MNPGASADFPTQRRAAPLAVDRPFARRYWLDACIGQGGLATIYRARDLEASTPARLVALKIADTPELPDEARMAMLAREAECLERFNHPALPSLIDAGMAEGWPFLVLPLIIGETLADALRRMAPRGLGAKRAAEILSELADALDHMHNLGLVHGDLKTSNILLPPDGTLRLIDFSSTRRLGETGIPGGAGLEAEVARVPLSTLFAAPEQFDGLPADPADDVFALGVLAHILLAGTHPFGRSNARDARRLGLPPKPPTTPKALPRHQWATICRALEFSRERRLASPMEFIAAFNTPRPLDPYRDALGALLRLLR